MATVRPLLPRLEPQQAVLTEGHLPVSVQRAGFGERQLA